MLGRIARLVVTRLLLSAVLLLGLVVAVLLLTDVLMSSDFASVFRLGLTAQEVEAIRGDLGLNRRIGVRALEYLGSLIRGDLGTAFSGADVGQIVFALLPFSLMMFLIGVGVALKVGWLWGARIGWRGRASDNVGLSLVAAVSTVFPPWLAFLLVYAFATLAGLRSFTALRRLDRQLWETSAVTPTQLTWLLVASVVVGILGALLVRRYLSQWGLTGRLVAVVLSFVVPLQAVATVSSWSLIGDVALLLSLPVLAVAIVTVADSVLLGAAVADGFRYEPWVFTAEAKGLEDGEIFDRYVRRTMLLPLLSRLVANIPLVLGSLVIVEYGFQAIGQDYSVAAYGLSSALFSA